MKNRNGEEERYEDGELREYLNEVTFTLTDAGMVVTGSNSASITTPSVTKFIPYNDDATYKTSIPLNGTYTVIRDYYSYYPETLTSSSNSEAIVGLARNSIAWNMLFEYNESGLGYILVDKYIDAKNGEAQWGLRHLSDGRVTGIHYWNSKTGAVINFDEWGNVGHIYLRVVIKISNISGMKLQSVATDSDGATTYNIVTS